MNTKQRTVMIFVLLLSLATSSCAPGQMFGPTITPTSTNTPLPPTATDTPVPPTSTSTPPPTDTPTSIPDWNGIPIIPGAINGQESGKDQSTLQGITLITQDYQFTTATTNQISSVIMNKRWPTGDGNLGQI